MSKDILLPQENEQIRSPEEFLDQLYDRTAEWLREDVGRVIQEFGPQEIKSWERLNDFHKGAHYLSLNLLKACLVGDSKKVFLLTLGRGKRSRRGDDNMRLQFGFYPSSSGLTQMIEDSVIEEVKWLVNQGATSSYGYGEIFAENNNIRIDCWADSLLYGGKNTTTWPSERILTTQGLEHSLDIIKETFRRAFGEDLT